MAKKNSLGGGAPLALSILGGAIVGIAIGQPSLGTLIGAGIGTLIAIAIWRKSR
jgi:hypothetical protein